MNGNVSFTVICFFKLNIHHIVCSHLINSTYRVTELGVITLQYQEMRLMDSWESQGTVASRSQVKG